MNVMNACRWTETVELPSLKQIMPESLGPRHQPINHGDALEMFRSRLEANNIKIGNERGLLSPNRMKYVYVADVNVNDTADYVFTVGFGNYNNRQRAFFGIAGEKVNVCSNECYGGIMPGSKRHTTNIGDRLIIKIDDIIETFKQFRERRTRKITQLGQTKFNDQNVANCLLYMIRNSAISNSDIARIVKEWDNPRHVEFEDKTAWSFQNCFTEIVKRTDNPIRRMELTSDIKKAIDIELTKV